MPATIAPAASAPHVFNYQARAALAQIIDAIFIVAASVVAGVGYHEIALGATGNLAHFLATGIVGAIIFCALAHLIESNHPLRISDAYERARDAAVAWIFTVLLFMFVTFTLKVGEDLSRGAVLSFFILGMVAAIGSHSRTPLILVKAKNAGKLTRRDAILLGACGDSALSSIAREIQQASCSEPRVVTFEAHCDSREWPKVRKAMNDSILQLAKSIGQGEIYVAASDVPAERLDSILRSLSLLPRPVLLIPDSATAALLRYPVTAVGGAVAVEIQKEPLNAMQRTIKRTMDLVLSGALLILLSPLLIGIALAIKWDSSGPVLFRQHRNGYQGRPFKILKFRSMTVLEDGESITQASQDDGRVTRIGRWMRRTSLDELPQLINVIKGEMSLVGPRPHARAHDQLYAKLIENYELRQHVKPGVTGWAQVNGLRGETAHVDRMFRRIEHDLWYAKHCSLGLDVQILARTVLVVAMRRHAY